MVQGIHLVSTRYSKLLWQKITNANNDIVTDNRNLNLCQIFILFNKLFITIITVFRNSEPLLQQVFVSRSLVLITKIFKLCLLYFCIICTFSRTIIFPFTVSLKKASQWKYQLISLSRTKLKKEYFVNLLMCYFRMLSEELFFFYIYGFRKVTFSMNISY